MKSLHEGPIICRLMKCQIGLPHVAISTPLRQQQKLDEHVLILILMLQIVCYS